MSALATALPVPCGAFMPVFVIGKKILYIYTCSSLLTVWDRVSLLTFDTFHVITRYCTFTELCDLYSDRSDRTEKLTVKRRCAYDW